MPTYDNLLYEKQRQGVLITWNRPETLNAISRQLEHELAEALVEAERDPEVRAIVMTGMGRAFSSGYDIGGERSQMVWPPLACRRTKASQRCSTTGILDQARRQKSYCRYGSSRSR